MKARPQLFGKTLFVDLMMSTLVVVTSLLMASIAIEKAKKTPKDANMRMEGEYAIVIAWPDDSTDDVDLYVRDPDGKIAYFGSHDVGLMHLEHDDQGGVSDSVRTHGRGGHRDADIKVQRNGERAVLRGIIPGEYIVNVHMYNKRAVEATPVSVILYRLKGEGSALVQKQAWLRAMGDEVTVFRLTLQEDGSCGEVNQLQFRMVGGVAQHAQGGH